MPKSFVNLNLCFVRAFATYTYKALQQNLGHEPQ